MAGMLILGVVLAGEVVLPPRAADDAAAYAEGEDEDGVVAGDREGAAGIAFWTRARTT